MMISPFLRGIWSNYQGESPSRGLFSITMKGIVGKFRMILLLIVMLTGDLAFAGNQVSIVPVTTGKFDLKDPANDDFFRKKFGLNERHSWEFVSVSIDIKGNEHRRFLQKYNGIMVKDVQLVFHSSPEGYFITGHYAKIDIPPSEYNLEEREETIRTLFHSSKKHAEGSGYYYVPDSKSGTITLTYELNFYPENDLHKQTLLIDVITLSKYAQFTAGCYANVPGVAFTAYQGSKAISCYADSGMYFLYSTLKGQGIYTKNLNHQLNYQQVSHYNDNDNVWQEGAVTNSNHATDAHYCAEGYYDFLTDKFNRNSLDNAGFPLVSYLNYGNNFANAFWNGQAVVYGSGNGSTGPLTTPDIAGHEFTHGLIQKTANLSYSGEPGILNEAISDIFGVALEAFLDSTQSNWLIGDLAGPALRSFSDPNAYNQPSAFHGYNWYYGTGDQGGVHINSGFINKWFYMLCEGEQNTNEFGTSYSVQGIGITKSTHLIYHTLTSYLVPNSGFDDFYVATLQSAVDLYGSCSPEYVSVLEAWKAVEFGNSNGIPVVQTDGVLCPGDSVRLFTKYTPGSVYTWLLNGVVMSSGFQSEIYITTPGNWVVSVTRCGQLLNSIPATVQSQTPANVTTQNVSACSGDPVLLEGFPEGGVFNVPNPYSGPATVFNYTFTDTTGCTSTASGIITIHLLPYVQLLTPDLLIPVNDKPLLLEANVQGIFSGTGVNGNFFLPETAGIGGPYKVELQYQNSEGCVGKDSIFIEVIEPCNRAASVLEITSPIETFFPGQLMTFKINSDTSVFNFVWEFPPGCLPVGPVNENSVKVLWNESNGSVKLQLTNTCNQIYNKSFEVQLQKPVDDFQVSVFPNPGDDFVTITIQDKTSHHPITIEMRDLSGKVILLEQSNSGFIIIPVQNISPGSYVLTISNAVLVKHQQLMIK